MQNAGCQELGSGGRGVSVNRYKASVWKNEKVLEIDGDDGYTTM